MDFGIEDPALSFALPIALGFYLFMHGLLVLITLARWKRSSETLRNIWTRTAVASPILFAILIALWQGPLAWGFLIGFFALISHREHCTASGLADRGMWWAGAGALVLLMVAAMTHGETRMAWSGAGGAGWLGSTLLLGLFAIWTVPLLQDRTEHVIRDAGHAMLAFLIGWLFLHGAFLLHLGPVGVGAAIFAVANVAMTDSFALITGRLIGRTPFRPVLSPKKTWEGVLGGILAGALAGWFGQPLLPGFSTIEAALLGAGLSVFGILGDLMLSAMKRDLGIKDWSSLLPGHGGLLDRVDSFLWVAPAMYWSLLVLGA